MCFITCIYPVFHPINHLPINCNLINMTKFSFIVPYRNRDTKIAKRCLLSLQNQKLIQKNNADYEVIFIDYGSDKIISDELEDFCTDLDKVNYVFNKVRGIFWSRSASINNGIYLAKGQYCIIADVDMIYSPNFWTK